MLYVEVEKQTGRDVRNTKRTLGQVVKAARLERGLTQQEVADKANISQAYYNMIENDREHPPTIYAIEKIASALELDRRELARMVEVRRIEYEQNRLDKKKRYLGIKTTGAKSEPIPILSDIPTNRPQERSDLDYPPGIAEDYYEFKVNDPNSFFLRAEGDCMSPEIKKGDLLLIYPNDKLENGDIAAVVNSKGEKEVRRVTMRENQVILTPDNPIYPTIVWEAKDKPKIIGRVKEIIRRR